LGVGKGVDFNSGLGGGRQNSLGSLALSSKSSHSSGVLSNINAVFLKEISRAELNQFVIEIFSSEMGVSGSGLNLENSVFNGKKGNIESTTSQIENKNVLFTLSFFVKTVSNSGSSGFVDNSQNV